MAWNRNIMKIVLAILASACLWSCQDNALTDDISSAKIVEEKTVAVVLPYEQGLYDHWHRCLDMFASNFERAFKSQDVAIRLKFEYYDESTDDLASLSRELGSRDDIYAVIGGLYSANSSIMTSSLTRLGKTFFTIATSEELVRAYASTGYLWAMTETDITQCEVLLSKVANYGGESVALIAKEGNIYCKTFIDWFAFQARELGLANKGVFTYDSSSLEEMTRQALQSGADYLICVPADIDEIEPMLASYEVSPRDGSASRPRLLFSDTAYGVDVLSVLGEKAEGLEGVTFGADPESGFDVSYKIFYGISPTTGEAQLYDAAMLLGYAAWFQHLNPDVSLQKALRSIVTGEDINMGRWTGEDMSLVVDALARGDAPYVRGASGFLRFDTKIFTNVLATTYYNYKVYDGKYIILDYNSSDGGNRTDATLAGWNWKASQMQDFENTGSIAYPEQMGNWAVLVATSTEWSNYRHQADVLAIYQQLKKNGYDDRHIILITEDDLAFHSSNPEPGVLRVVPGGENVYENVEIDYRLSDLEPSDFLNIIQGNVTARTPEILGSGASDNVFIFLSGHGVQGAMCWNEDDYGLTADVLYDALAGMVANERFRKLLMMTEACFSGGVMERCQGIPGALFITAANGEESSKADIFNGDLKVWMSNRFTSTFIEQITENASVSLRDLYYRLFINTVGSHVMVYNAHYYGNLYTSDMEEFINFKN